MAVSLFERWSPEYALVKTFDDVRESGLDGLKQHLTSNALKTVEGIEAIACRPEVSLLASALKGTGAVKTLLEKLSECEWTVKDVLKGSETSKAEVGFNYQDKMVGTIELAMVKEDKTWKIDGLALPTFDKLIVSTGSADASEE